MICARCDQPIKPGQGYETAAKFSPSTGGATIYLHKGWCKKTPHQSIQESIRH